MLVVDEELIGCAFAKWIRFFFDEKRVNQMCFGRALQPARMKMNQLFLVVIHDFVVGGFGL